MIENLEKYIDHTLLKSTAKQCDYDKLINEGLEHSFYSLCVPPSWLSYVKKQLKLTGLKGSANVKVCSVAGFPMGYSDLEVKDFEIKTLFEAGADEVDVVLNISKIKSKNWTPIENELKCFSDHSQNKTIKVIVESGVLSECEIQKICELFNRAPATFIKTSTGFAEAGAKLKDVEVMRKNLNSQIKIKASGGIKNFDQARAFIEAGADRLGTSSSVEILNKGLKENERLSDY